MIGGPIIQAILAQLRDPLYLPVPVFFVFIALEGDRVTCRVLYRRLRDGSRRFG